MARKQEKEVDPAAGLMVMMVSLNLILLIFFVYLNSMGVDDDQKIKKALGSLAGTFGMLPSGAHLTDGKTLLIPGAPLAPPSYSSMTMGDQFRRLIRDNGFEEEGFVIREGDDLIIHLADKVLFESGRATLRSDTSGLLGDISKVIHRHPFPIRIEGYTDNVPISTVKYPSNWELSAERATAILEYLHDEQKIPSERLTAVGFGEYRPLVPNDRPKNREKNRRVRIVLVEAAK